MPDPAKTDDAVVSAVQRSMPNPKRPRLKTSTEHRFAPIEHAAAAQYASMETYSAQFNQLALQIEAEQDAEDLASAGVVTQEQKWDDDSMVHHIVDLTVQAKTPP